MSNTFFLSIEIFTRDAKSTDINAYNVYGDDDADEDDCRLRNPPAHFVARSEWSAPIRKEEIPRKYHICPSIYVAAQ